MSLTLPVYSLPSEPPVNPPESKAQTIKKIVIGLHIWIITLNVDRLNAPIKRYRQKEQKKARALPLVIPLDPTN